MTTEWNTSEEFKAHHAKCPELIKCKHEAEKAGKLNEYGDCYDCDGEGKRMCAHLDSPFMLDIE